jgi:hypothetical protein
MVRFLFLLLAASLAFAAHPVAAYSVLTTRPSIDSTMRRSRKLSFAMAVSSSTDGKWRP